MESKRIMYVYSISDTDELNKYKNYHLISDNKENYNLCVYREKWQEIEFFSKTNNCLFYNTEQNKITDTNFNIFEYDSDIILFPRMSIPITLKFINNFKCISSIESYRNDKSWYKNINNDITKRKIIYGNILDIEKNFEYYLKQVKDSKNRFFIKSSEKHWSFSGDLNKWYEDGGGFFFNLGSDHSECIISEFIDIKTDNLSHKKCEYRCYYFFGKLTSISRYVDYDEHEIPEHILETAKSYEKILNKLSNTIVIDIADTVDRGPVFLEANNICSSGRYFNNKVDTFPLFS